MPFSLVRLLVVDPAPAVWNSIASTERFSETLDPGYVLIKTALWLMVLLALADRSGTPCTARGLMAG